MFKKREETIEFQVLDYDDFNYVDGEDIDWDEYIKLEEIRERDNKEVQNQIKAPKAKKNNIKKINKGDSIYYKKDKKYKLNTGITIILLLYIIFVLFGYLTTTFDQTRDPQVINVELRENRKYYNIAKRDYDTLFQLVRIINTYDSELTKSDFKEAFSYSVKYQELLKYCEAGEKQVKGVEYAAEYRQLQLENAQIYDEIKIYLKDMSKALSTGNKSLYDEALAIRNKYISHFNIYENNIKRFQEIVNIQQ